MYSHVTDSIGVVEEDDKTKSTAVTANVAYGVISTTVPTTTNEAYGMVPYDHQASGKEDSPTYELVDQPLPSSAIPTPASAATPSSTQKQCHKMEEPAY